MIKTVFENRKIALEVYAHARKNFDRTAAYTITLAKCAERAEVKLAAVLTLMKFGLGNTVLRD